MMLGTYVSKDHILMVTEISFFESDLLVGFLYSLRDGHICYSNRLVWSYELERMCKFNKWHIMMYGDELQKLKNYMNKHRMYHG